MVRARYLLFPIIYLFAMSAPGRAQEPDSLPASGEPLTLRGAVAAALANNPSLAAQSWEPPLSAARTEQAALRPNPEVSIELENLDIDGGERTLVREGSFSLGVDGTADWRSSLAKERSGGGAFEEAQLTLRLSQVLELGGKRAARIQAAARGEDVAAWDYEAARFRLAAEVVRRFTAVLAWQERLHMQQALVDSAKEVAEAVGTLVDTGAAPPLEGRRVSVETDRLRAEAMAAEAALQDARIHLAAMWGSPEPGFSHAAGDWTSDTELPALEALLAQRENVPSLRRWSLEMARREAAIELADSNAVPDVTLSLGYRVGQSAEAEITTLASGTSGLSIARGNATRDPEWNHSLVLEAAIPLPVFDRNQGERRGARLAYEQARDEMRGAELAVVTTLTRFHETARQARERAGFLEGEVLPELERVLELTREGYQAGKFDLLAVLDAERGLMEARLHKTEARISYIQTIAAIEGVLGTPLTHITTENNEMEPTAAGATAEEEATP